MYLDEFAAGVARNRGQDWILRLETPDGRFWQASGVGAGQVEIRWGKGSGQGRSQTTDWNSAVYILYGKFRDGFTYVAGTKGPSRPKPALSL